MTGKIEVQVRAILDAEPDNAFTLEELCLRVYDADEKKHRVSMLRVVKRICEVEPRYVLMRKDQRGGEFVIADGTNLESYAMGRMKGNWGYRYKTSWGVRINTSEKDLRADLRKDRYTKLMAEGGAWWRHVEMHTAEVNGDRERYEQMKREQDAAMARSTVDLKARLTGEPPPEDLARQAAKLLMRYFERTGETEVRFEKDGQVYLKAECFQTEARPHKETQ